MAHQTYLIIAASFNLQDMMQVRFELFSILHQYFRNIEEKTFMSSSVFLNFFVLCPNANSYVSSNRYTNKLYRVILNINARVSQVIQSATAEICGSFLFLLE